MILYIPSMPSTAIVAYAPPQIVENSAMPPHTTSSTPKAILAAPVSPPAFQRRHPHQVAPPNRATAGAVTRTLTISTKPFTPLNTQHRAGRLSHNRVAMGPQTF